MLKNDNDNFTITIHKAVKLVNTNSLIIMMDDSAFVEMSFVCRTIAESFPSGLFHVKDNHIKHLIDNISTLTMLDLSQSHMELTVMIQIAKSLCHNTKLRQLNIYGNVETFSSEVEFIIDVIMSAKTNLLELIVNDTNLRPRLKNYSKILTGADDVESFSLQHLYIANKFPLYLSNHYIFKENYVKRLDGDKKSEEVRETCPFDHAEIFIHYVDYKGGIYYYKDHDVALFIPPGAILQDDYVEINVSTSFHAPFNVPLNYSRISSYVWIGANYDFKIPVYLVINHFLDIKSIGHNRKLTAFEACKLHRIMNSDETVVMQEIATSYFDADLQYCVISTCHFCTYCLAKLKKQDDNFVIEKNLFHARYFTYQEEEFQNNVSYVAEICCMYRNINCYQVSTYVAVCIATYICTLLCR